jgi:hypothetical protein
LIISRAITFQARHHERQEAVAVAAGGDGADDLVTSDADNHEIERAIKRDVSLALNLLRLVNTPAVGARQRIDSLSQAVTILGRRQLQRWLQIMLYAEPSKRGHSMTPLLMLATTRGRLLELLAGKLRPSQRESADIAFTVGIMSLMDTLFGISMAEILEQIPVSDDVRNALLTQRLLWRPAQAGRMHRAHRRNGWPHRAHAARPGHVHRRTGGTGNGRLRVERQRGALRYRHVIPA